MVNWQVFEIKNIGFTNSYALDFDRSCSSNTYWTLCLDEYVEFADGYKKEIDISIEVHWVKFIEIDLDQTRLRKSNQKFKEEVLRKIPEEVAIRRRMESVASADPTALAVAREAMDKVSRGELREVECKIVDNSDSLRYHFIYRK